MTLLRRPTGRKSRRAALRLRGGVLLSGVALLVVSFGRHRKSSHPALLAGAPTQGHAAVLPRFLSEDEGVSPLDGEGDAAAAAAEAAVAAAAAGEAAADAGSKDTCRRVLDRPFDRDYPALATALYIVGILYIFLGESRRARAQEDSGGEHPAPATSHVQELLVGGVTSDDEPLAAPAAQRYTHCIRSGVSTQAVRAT